MKKELLPRPDPGRASLNPKVQLGEDAQVGIFVVFFGFFEPHNQERLEFRGRVNAWNRDPF